MGRGSRLILLTAHRRENLGEPMREMFQAIRRIVDETPDIKVIYPMHKKSRSAGDGPRLFRRPGAHPHD